MRLQKLEQANRRLKRGAIAIIAIALAVLSMGQARAPGIVSATKFALVDSSGTQRALLFLDKGVPKLELLDMLGKPDVTISGSDGLTDLNATSSTAAIELSFAGRETVKLDGGPSASIDLESGYEKSNERALLQASAIGSELSFFSGDSPLPVAQIERSGLHLESADGGTASFGHNGIYLRTAADGTIDAEVSDDGRPSLEILDRDGFNAVLGATNLVTASTGRREATSAANLTLFDKDGKVLWTAPH